MWIESSVQVGDRPVVLCVECLDDEERERTAAQLAWLTIEAFGCGAEGATVAWHEFVAGILRQHVTFSIPEEQLAGLGHEWWNEAMGRALLQFVRQNGLALSVNRHIDTLRLAVAGRTES